MKSWLVFLGGIFCGVAVSLGIVRIWFARPATTLSNENVGKNAAAAAVSVEQVSADPADGAMDPAELEARVGVLRAWAEGRGREPDNTEFYETLAAWSQRDPRLALAWVRDARRLPQRLRVMALPLAALARENPAEAAGWLRDNVDAQNHSTVLQSAFQHLASTEPRKALDLVSAFPRSEQPDDLGDALGKLIEDSSDVALSYFGRLTGQQREYSARWMVASWARKDAGAASAWLEGNADLIAVGAVRWAFLEECGRSRPDLCVDFLKRFPNPSDPYSDSSVIGALLQQSVDHGVAALAVVTPETAEAALSQWVRDCFEKSPERAIELTRKWAQEKTQGGLIRSGFESWLDSDNRAAMEWLGAVTQPELRATLQAGVIGWQAQRDPEAALLAISGHQGASPELRDVAAEALMGWASKDVVAASGWLVANPDAVSVPHVAAFADQLLRENEEAGAGWLAKLPPGDVRDAAVSSAAAYWATNAEPELATQVASTIRDPEKRTQTLFSVYSALRSADEAGAEEWLGKQALSSETRQAWRTISASR